MARPKPQSLSQILLAALPRERLLSVDLVRLKWREAVGVELARRSAPVALENGILTVRVAEAAWGKEVVKLQWRIIANLEKALGASFVARIRFVKGTGPFEADSDSPRRFVFPQTRSLAVREAAESISDAELRDKLIRTAERYLSAQAARRRSS